MKKIMMMLTAAVGLAAMAGQDNLLMKFSTVGPDTYADGKTPVADGEFYALVWVKAGAAFAGFNADGTVVDAENSALICAVPYAENGRCPETVLEIDRVLADAYAGAGAFELHVMDTRRRRQAEGETRRGRECIWLGGNVRPDGGFRRRGEGGSREAGGAGGDGICASSFDSAAEDHVHQSGERDGEADGEGHVETSPLWGAVRRCAG